MLEGQAAEHVDGQVGGEEVGQVEGRAGVVVDVHLAGQDAAGVGGGGDRADADARLPGAVAGVSERGAGEEQGAEGGLAEPVQ
ncbi:hypothetical protein D3C78_1285830 [compost metagenome]